MNRWFRVVSVAVVISLVFGMGVWVGSRGVGQSAYAQGQPVDTEALFEPFWEAWGIVHDSFVNPNVDDEKLMQGAIRGLVGALEDERSAYLDPDAYELQTSRLQGEYEGIGASVRKDTTTGGVLIVTTFRGSPAREALRAGDIIVTVNGEDITTLSLTEAISQIRGPAGTTVRLGILREGEREIKQVTVRRARIQQDNLTYGVYEGNIGYIQIAQFTDTTTQELSKALAAIDANNLNGLVLDMRNDPGGPLADALNVASMFLPDGTIMIEKGRRSPDPIVYESTATDLERVGLTVAPDVPLVVILNQASASASELVAGALQDRGRAKVVGTLSFGKGSIQVWHELGDGSGLIVTVANFFKPSGGQIDGIGIIPDVVVPWTEDQQEARPNYDPQLTEALWLLQGKF